MILSALNPPPAHFAFLDALGFDSQGGEASGILAGVLSGSHAYLSAQS